MTSYGANLESSKSYVMPKFWTKFFEFSCLLLSPDYNINFGLKGVQVVYAFVAELIGEAIRTDSELCAFLTFLSITDNAVRV